MCILKIKEDIAGGERKGHVTDMELKKKLPIGIEEFEKIRTEDFYYIDKTGLIKELLYNWGEVNLFTRPRRFGKSLNMSMLKNFFEIEGNQDVFNGLEIVNEKELCEKYMGKFPVISISLKGVNGDSFETARSMMSSAIGKEALQFQFLLDSEKLSGEEKKMYSQLIMIDNENGNIFKMSDSVLIESLKTLAMLLEKHYEQKVIVLIDEYDVPLAKAFENRYYEQMVSMVRNLFEQTLKSNKSLYLAVLTGCMRISKESVFTGLNNMKVLSISDVRFDEYFGFTDADVKKLLKYYQLSDYYRTIKEWYDGYRFGNVDVYCPWDVINYCDALRTDKDAKPQNYWANTSGNDAVKHFIEKSGNSTVKREIEYLVAGETIEKEIHQELTYNDMYQSVNNIWSVLFTTGYLTQRGKSDEDVYCLTIPNMEIRKIFTRQIMEYFKETVQEDGETLNVFCEALKSGDAKGVEEQFGEYLRKTISIRDTFAKKKLKENFYHGILLGLLGFKESWGVFSNKESGDGYSDIAVEIDDEGIGIIIEVKYSDNGNLDTECRHALAQIRSRNYEEQLRDDGMRRILKYGIACYKKQCKVVIENEKE